MTREEQKAKDAKKYYPYDINCYCAFLDGAQWSDEHPVNIWHDASEEPKENSEIVIADTEGELRHIDYASDDYDGWEFCIAHYNLKIWAYKSDLLPKGGKR